MQMETLQLLLPCSWSTLPGRKLPAGMHCRLQGWYIELLHGSARRVNVHLSPFLFCRL